MNKLSIVYVALTILITVILSCSCNQKPNPTVNWPPMPQEWNDPYEHACIDAGEGG